MKLHGSTELVRMMSLQRHSAATRGALDRAAQEMSSGLKADKHKATGGNLARLFGLERMLERNAAHLNAIGLTSTRLDFAQESLGRVLSLAQGLSTPLLGAVGLDDMISARIQAEAAKRAFVDTVSMINVRASGESLFAGDAVDQPALKPAEDILAALFQAVGDPGDAAEALARLEVFFAPASFAAAAYAGSPDRLAPAEVGERVRVDASVLATEPALVAALKAHATAALVAGGGPLDGAPRAVQAAVLGAAGNGMLAASDALLALRSRVGLAQETVERAQAERTAEREAYELARARIVGADPFDAATAFQALQSQLETVFTVTARLSGLRFANFMR
jgi:flagellar hook-associated protein 3 FlgL